jgi:DNA-binding SARP family transcriptional activator
VIILRFAPPWESRPSGSQRLVALIALNDQPLSRAQAAGVLWPDTTISKANANLRSTLWRIQRSCPLLVNATAQQLFIDGCVEVDVRSAVAMARRLLDNSAPGKDTDIDVPARAIMSADLLPDWSDDWVVVERERFHQLRLHALESMCERLTAAGRHGEAVDTGLAVVRAEPLRESAHRVLVKAYLAEGNCWEAIRQYERCRILLLGELGLKPSIALHELLPTPARDLSR